MRAYQPRRQTLELVRRIRALEGVARVDILPPHTWQTVRQPSRLKVTLTPGASPEPASTIFSLSEARQWLAYEERIPADFHCLCGWSRTVLPWESKAEVRAQHESGDLHRAAIR